MNEDEKIFYRLMYGTINLCRNCRRPEYWGKMRWLNGQCLCRDCYRDQWERENHKPYKWTDLDGRRPTMQEYADQVNEAAVKKG